MLSHPRYWAGHKNKGTPAKPKTIRRMRLQQAHGMTTVAKRTVTPHGMFIHPTKGQRPV